MSGGGTTQNTVQNKDPWAPTQPYLQQIMQQGSQLYNSGAGSQTWNGPLVAPQSNATQAGIGMLTNVANQQQLSAGIPYLYGQNQIQNNGLTGGYNAPMSTYGNVASGQNGITTGGAFGDVANGVGPTSSATNLGGMASGADAGKNPYLMDMLSANDARIANQVNSSFAGLGRYGSAGHGDALARTINATNLPVLANAYETDRNRMLSASGQIDQSQRAAEASKLAALQGQTGVQGQNISNQMQGAQGQTGILNTGQQNATNWAQLLPTLQQAAYSPGNTLMGLGDYQNQYGQQNIDAQRQLFEQQQSMPWTQLNRYLGSVSGLGGLLQGTGTTTGTQNTEKNLGIQDYMSMFGGGGNSQAAGVANAGSALLGLLSDRDEKTDIKKLGKDEATGLDIYSYRYKSDPKTYPKVVGPMAQDIEKAMPGSTDRVGGKLYVKPEAVEAFGLLAYLNKKAA